MKEHTIINLKPEPPQTVTAVDGNIESFMNALLLLCTRHNVVIGWSPDHENFVIHPWDATRWEQIEACRIDVAALHPAVQQQIKDAASGN